MPVTPLNCLVIAALYLRRSIISRGKYNWHLGDRLNVLVGIFSTARPAIVIYTKSTAHKDTRDFMRLSNIDAPSSKVQTWIWIFGLFATNL